MSILLGLFAYFFKAIFSLIFDYYITLLQWGLRPRPPPVFCLWTALGDVRPPKPLFCTA